jgi:zinc/manganese transport system substrate-binding protein
MQRSTKIVAILAVAIVAAGAIGYEVYASSAPSSACAATTTTYQAPASAPVTIAKASTIHGTVTDGAALVRAHASSTHSPASSGVIPVVAAENFWGSLVSQLGGNRTSVLSIVTDPNADPHEYEANSSDAIAVTNAQFVIVNGVGYDDWALQLISADGNPNQLVLNVGDLNGVSVTGGIITGNPHMWYNPTYVNRTVAAMYSDLVSIQPSSRSYFQANYAVLNFSLGQLYSQANHIRALFAGTVVASTESIFVYLANYTGLDLVSPPAFMEAIAEGNDPPAQSVVEFQCQLESGHVSVLIYNEQTVTPITSNMKVIAAENNVTIVGITETIQPPDETFQFWMGAEYQALENALNAKALGQ